MAEYSLITSTAVPVNGTIPYNNTICPGCCDIRHRNGSGIVTVKGGTCCKPKKYNINFHANVRGVVGAIQLGLFLDGELLPETLMSVVPGGANDVWTVGAATEICQSGCCASISARVITGATVTVDTANIIIHEEVGCNG